MKVLELTNYSSGICGVWARVKEESEGLSRLGYEVKIFSSNLTKGSNNVAPPKGNLGKIEIKRFASIQPGTYPLHFLPGGESYMFWNFKEAGKEIRKFKPDLIIVHSYRHTHNLFALRMAKKIGAKVFLVTHAPFVEEDATRSFWGHSASWFYNYFIGSKTINKFDKVITITHWEEPYLKKLGVKPEKLAYIPNGIPGLFFKYKKKVPEENKILFLGRIAPIKDLETLISAFALIKNKKIKLELVGPAEEGYLLKLKDLIKKKFLEKRVTFSGPIYNLEDKLSKIDSSKIFILPSKREAMPQSLIEAMARKKIVISSNNPGSKEIVLKEGGFLFNVGDATDLAKKVDSALSLSPKARNKIKLKAFNSVNKFNWERVIKSLDLEIKK
ncbi:Glycosyltransferase Gtf1 [uncultured archaeon]|nr:Glycosyltransferase Gtf1 [uncultured archaeon]